jgi:hypothetical protein
MHRNSTSLYWFPVGHPPFMCPVAEPTFLRSSVSSHCRGCPKPQGQQRGNCNSSQFQMRTLRYSLRRVSPLDSVNGGTHNPKVGGSNPPPATNSINHLAGFTDFHLGQIRVTNSRYCTEVVIVGHSTQTSFSGFQPSCSALFFTKSTKRRCNSRLASICGAPYTWEVVVMFSCRSRVFTSSSVNPASLPQALTLCRKLCQPIFGSPALTATGCT